MAKISVFLGIVLVQSLLILYQFSSVQAAEDDKAEITVTYHLWHDNKPSSENGRIQRLGVQAEHNNTFHRVMDIAKLQKPEEYGYEADEYPFGTIITSIGGTDQKPEENLYWMLYKIDGEPNPSNPPSNSSQTKNGVDQTFVSHGENYLFWRKEEKW